MRNEVYIKLKEEYEKLSKTEKVIALSLLIYDDDVKLLADITHSDESVASKFDMVKYLVFSKALRGNSEMAKRVERILDLLVPFSLEDRYQILVNSICAFFRTTFLEPQIELDEDEKIDLTIEMAKTIGEHMERMFDDCVEIATRKEK